MLTPVARQDVATRWMEKMDGFWADALSLALLGRKIEI